MTRFFRENYGFILVMALWVLTGKYAGPLIYLVLPATVLFYMVRRMDSELLIGFFFILILSDSRQPGLAFAESIKNVHIVMLALYFFSDMRNYLQIDRTFVRFIPFFLVAFFCLFFSEDVFMAFQKTLSYFLVLIVVTNLSMKLIKEEGESFLARLIYFGFALLLYGLFLRVISPGVVILEERYTGVLGNPNGLGVFSFLFFILYSVTTYIYPNLFTRTEKWAIVLSIMVSIFLCGSRSAILSVLLFLLFRYFYRISAFLGFIAFLAAVLVYQYVSLNLVNIVIALGLQEYFRIDTLEDGSGRLVAWNFAWQNINDNFFIGKGFFYTEYLYKKFYTFLSMQGHQGNAHNSYLTLWLDTGLLGLVLYLFAFLSSFVIAARRTHLAIPILYAVLFSANFESWLSGSLNPFTIQVWIALAVLGAAGDVAEPTEEESPEPAITT